MPGDEIQRLTQRIDQIDKALATQTQDSERVAQRVDHLDRALVAEAKSIQRALLELSEAGRALAERITAVNGALTRRMMALGDDVRATTAAELNIAAEQRAAQARASEQILHYFVAERRARADQSFWVLRALRRYLQRGVDLRAALGGGFPRLWQGPEVPRQADARLQAGTFFSAGVPRSYPLVTTGSSLHGIEIGILATLPPLAPAVIADFELIDGTATVLRAGTAGIDASCVTDPMTIGFESVPCEPGQTLTLKLTPHANVERIGVQLLEWHRVTRFLRRVPEQRLAWRGMYGG